ncbi:MAG: ACT domain-containing protein [Deltaproteobacteria bacterium]|nr:ACT domain-containing protein [Deltaproteobacteria bacterium]
MVRQQISLFLKNAPGELGRLANLLAANEINLEAMSIQDASAYVMELFKARGKSLKRIASTESYNSMRRDSEKFALIRFLVNRTDETIDLLNRHDYLFDVFPVIALHLENRPGALAGIAGKFGREGINIKYTYGSVTESEAKVLFVFCPEDIDKAAEVFADHE